MVSGNTSERSAAQIVRGQGVPTGGLIINEIMADPSAVADGSGEWFELYNSTDKGVPLQGLIIEDSSGSQHVIADRLIVPAPGQVNTCASISGPLVINEIMQNPAAVLDSSGEWFELFNPLPVAVDISGWTIDDDDTESQPISGGGPLLILPGEYFVLGNNPNPETNGGVDIDYLYDDIALENSSDELVLADRAGTVINRVAWDDGATFPDPDGASMQLIDPGLNNELGSNWCQSRTLLPGGDLGTPGAANDCRTPARQLVINEIMVNPAAVPDSSGEWFDDVVYEYKSTSGDGSPGDSVTARWDTRATGGQVIPSAVSAPDVDTGDLRLLLQLPVIALATEQRRRPANARDRCRRCRCGSLHN